MRFDPKLSERIEILRFPLIVGIVFIHMYTDEIRFSGTLAQHNPFAMTTEYLSDILARVSVPLFFAISGYLFFFAFDGTMAAYRKKMRSRLQTLVIPFLFWNALIFVFFAIAQNLPLTAHYFTGERPLVLSYGLWDQIQLFFGFGKFAYPVAYQFWFIRDLIILAALSPLLYYLLQKAAFWVLSILFLLWLTELPPIDMTSWFFFTFGAWLAMRRFDFEKSGRYALLIILLYLLLSIVDVLTENLYIENSTVLVGTAAIFCLSRYLVQFEGLRSRLLQLAKYSFFVFAVHEPLLSIVRKISFKVVAPQSDWTVLALYFFAPTVTILSAIMLYHLLARIAPSLLKLATGNRL